MTGSRRSPRVADASRLLVVFSDIEMGAGGPEDDFPHSDFLGELVLSYNEEPHRDLAVDLVFNGDTFDLLKTDYLGEYTRHITRGVAVGKMERIAAAHPQFFEALDGFLEHQHAERRVFFLTGNHDAELYYPEVQQLIHGLCGEPGQVEFSGLRLDIGQVHIEHGAQEDPFFCIDEAQPVLEFNGEEVLNISWGAAALLDTVMPLKPLLYFYDRLKPKNRAVQIVPEVRELLIDKMWKYWTRDYWKGWLSSADPTRKLTWTMVKEIVSRLSSQDVQISTGNAFRRRMIESDRYPLYVVGHEHEAGWWSFGDRKTLQTGCMRNEYMIKEDGKVLHPIPKTYAEVYLRDDAPVVSHLVEIEGPPAPAGYLPDSIFDVLPQVRELLGPSSERAQEHVAQREQEKREAEHND